MFKKNYLFCAKIVQNHFDKILINADLEQAKEELGKLITDFIKK